MSPRSLLLPVETLNRELDAKLLLALHAAERGWEVVVGKKMAMHDNIARFPRSIYMAKGFRRGDWPMFRNISGLGHAIVGFDEEGLVNVSDEMWLIRSDSETLGLLALVFAWGPNDARLYGLAKRIGGTPVVESGNPRVDLLRPELASLLAPEVERLRARFGRFALLNTNFALVNPHVGGQVRFKTADWVSEEKAAAMKSQWLGHKAQLLDAFKQLLPRLAEALAPAALVVRPHPSEDSGTWTEAASDLENVHVVSEGAVAPWLAAAEVLIHNGCTTAVEASVLGTPALSYRPVRKPGFDNDLPNGLSLECDDAEALIAAAVEAARAGRHGPAPLDPGRRQLLQSHLAALDGPLACSRVLDGIERHLSGPPPADARRYLAARARLLVRAAKRRARRRSDWGRNKAAHTDHRFPHVTADQIGARIDRLNGALGGVAEVEIGEVVPDLFRISKRR